MAESEFTCPHYRSAPGTKRCESYQEGGTCALPEYFHCIEWEKRNQAHLAAVRRGETARAEKKIEPPPRLDLFGQIVREPEEPKRTERKATPEPSLLPPVSLPVEPLPDRPGMTTEDIETFKQLGVEVQLTSDEFGDFFLVPEYTSKDRNELTPEHAATIARTLEVFPGSRVTAFKRRKGKESLEEDQRDADGQTRSDRIADAAEKQSRTKMSFS